MTKKFLLESKLRKMIRSELQEAYSGYFSAAELSRLRGVLNICQNGLKELDDFVNSTEASDDAGKQIRISYRNLLKVKDGIIKLINEYK